MSIEELEHDFDAITIADFDDIKEYLARGNYEESNHNLLNLYLWLDWYPLFKVKTDHYYLLLGIHEGELFLYMPLCEEKYFKEAIVKAKSIFDHYHVPFVLSCFTKDMIQHVLDMYPNFTLCTAEESNDYIYLTEKLITLSGKKLQKKRNHLNAFYSLYQDRYVYESFNHENVKECRTFLDEWKKDENEDDDFFVYEKKGVARLLENYDTIKFKGGCIRIDGQVRAFAIGSVLSDRMCQENVEKADDSYRGLYQAMMSEMLKHEFSEYEYCNREDDMGRENIRHAKRAYAPVMMIEKYRLCREEG